MNVRKEKTKLYLRRLIREICGAPDVDINDALATAQLAHLGQRRRSGEDYIEHPKQVAQIVYDYYQDPVLCAAALLHDTLEDAVAQGNAESDEEMASLIAGSFGDPSLGDDVLRLVRSLTHEKSVPYTDYLIDLASDPQALKVKLADVLHNLSSSPSEKQIQKYGAALEALRSEYGEPPAGISGSHWKALKNVVGMTDLREVLVREYRKTLSEGDEFELEMHDEVREKISLDIPDDLNAIYAQMKQRGKKLFVVGGAVRDTIMGKEPKDYDLATDASPDQVIKILEQQPDLRLDLTGKSFGVVRVKTPEENEYEIATFREDIGSGRRPDSVRFADIKTDVMRRDLTINALFYDIDTGEAVDYVGGIEDIKKGVIRAVGNPSERFAEDKLRILRAVRFAARMGSEIGPETADAIREDNNLAGVSVERIRDEFLKGMNTAQSIQGFLQMVEDLDLFPQIFPGLNVDIPDSESQFPPTQLALMLDTNGPEDVVRVLKKMKYTNGEIDLVGFLIRFKDITKDVAPKLKKEFSRIKMDHAVLTDYADASGAPSRKVVDAFLKFAELPPAADPRDLMSQGLKGPDIGAAMQKAEEEAYEKMTNEQVLRETIRMLVGARP